MTRLVRVVCSNCQGGGVFAGIRCYECDGECQVNVWFRNYVVTMSRLSDISGKMEVIDTKTIEAGSTWEAREKVRELVRDDLGGRGVFYQVSLEPEPLK